MKKTRLFEERSTLAFDESTVNLFAVLSSIHWRSMHNKSVKLQQKFAKGSLRGNDDLIDR